MWIEATLANYFPFLLFVLFCLPYQPTFIRGTMMGKQWSYLNSEMQYSYTLMVSLDLFLRQLLCTNPLARGPPPLASSSRSERNCGHFLAMYGLLPIWSKVKNCQKKTTINKGRQKALFTERLLLQLTLDTWHLKWKISSNTKPFRNSISSPKRASR